MGRPTPQEKLAILARRKRVAFGYLRGDWQHEIAAREGVTQQCISLDLAWLRDEWKALGLRDFDAAKQQELAKVDHLETIAWAAWERSCQNAEVLHAGTTKGRTTKDGQTLLPELVKSYKTSKGQSGNPAFLERVAWCIAERCKILGLIVERKELTGAEGGPLLVRVIETVIDAPQTRTLEVSLKLHPKQKRFLDSPALMRGFVGGRGAGKSWIGSYDLLQRSQPGRLYLVGAPTYRQLLDSTLRSFTELARKLHALDGPVNKSSMSCRLRHGAEILFRSADDPERFRGPNLSGVWLDEASLMRQEACTISIACLREAGEQGWFSACFTPKGKLHWTYEVFGRQRPGVELIHARTGENPFLPATFERTLQGQYTSILAAQELGGEFVDGGGVIFRRDWFPLVDRPPAGSGITWVRSWDLAATEAKEGKDPDWTAGVLMGRDEDGRFAIADVRRIRATPAGVEDLIKRTARQDGVAVPIRMEQEPGASGKTLIDHYQRRVLTGYILHPVAATGDKQTRALPLAAQAEAGNVSLVRGEWNKDLLDEMEIFPYGGHDDQVDAASMAFNELVGVLKYEFGMPSTIEEGLSYFAPEHLPEGIFLS